MEEYQKEFLRVKDTLKANPNGLTITEIAKKININRNSVAKYLDIMLISGYVERRYIGPAKLFFLSQRTPLSALLNFSSDYIAVLNKNLEVIQLNENLLKLISVKKESYVGKNIKDIPCPFFTNKNMLLNFKKALNGKEIKSEIHLPIRKKEFYFSFKLVPTTFEDGDIGVTIIAEDITKDKQADKSLRESEEKFKSIINFSPNAITVSDLNVNIIECNPETLKMHGFSSKEEVIGKNALELIAPEDRDRAIENAKKTLEKGSLKNIKYTFLRKDGSKFQGELSASVIRDISGKPILFVAITKDITGLKK
ncbi:MAG: PAS domain S-box protein [Candidatus Woesearchaeota archaeon]|nr:MAG: PAS domain S-box protein [Candidatus Woesearchaeota archaeon]